MAARRAAAACCALALAALLLACGATLPISGGARWACPSPTPLPWGPGGPVKGYAPVGTPDPQTGAQAQRPIYFAEWEREYGPGGALLGGQGALAGPPFPSPTPYGWSGASFRLGQRVEVSPLHVAVSAEAGAPAGEAQRYWVTLSWRNPTGVAQPIDYPSQLALRTIRRADGTLQSGDGWGVSGDELRRHGLALPRAVAPGESQVRLPILAPPGQPQVVELRLPIARAAPGATATPNPELRDPSARRVAVQWAAEAPLSPPCDDPGALTDWGNAHDPKAEPRDARIELRAPPGAPRVVQVALAQVGRPYVWGAAGPTSFDCSGLMQWSYAQIGVAIPRTTAGQWPGLRAIALGEAQPGDLVFFDTRAGHAGPPRAVTHVGMLADVDGDGRWDLIHAASPRQGVRVEYDLLGARYYAARMFPEARSAR